MPSFPAEAGHEKWPSRASGCVGTMLPGVIQCMLPAYPRPYDETKLCAQIVAIIQVCLKGTLFTPLSEHNTSTQSLNVQLRKLLDLHVNLVHGWTMPGVPSRFEDIDIVVIRYLLLISHIIHLLVIRCVWPPCNIISSSNVPV